MVEGRGAVVSDRASDQYWPARDIPTSEHATAGKVRRAWRYLANAFERPGPEVAGANGREGKAAENLVQLDKRAMAEAHEVYEAMMNPQLAAWTGEFGNEYIKRSGPDEKYLKILTRQWAILLQRMNPLPVEILEVGCNIGLNLRALKRIVEADLFAIEPNGEARMQVLRDGVLNVGRIFDADASRIPFNTDRFDLAFTSGVLIHIHPDNLAAACKDICRVSKRYVLSMEYFSDQPREVKYRGNDGLLWTRDYGQFWLDTCPELRMVDSGFFSRQQWIDAANWWLMEKR